MALSKFKRWYQIPENRNRLNKRRLHRYRTDPEYRAAVLDNTRRWRELHREDLKKPKLPKTSFTIGEVAKIIGVEQKTLRTLEKAKLIPKTAKAGQHRRYKKNQITLISAIVKHRKKIHYTHEHYQPRLNRLVERAWLGWRQ